MTSSTQPSRAWLVDARVKKESPGMFRIRDSLVNISSLLYLSRASQQWSRLCSSNRRKRRGAARCGLFALSVCVPSSHADSESPWWQEKQKGCLWPKQWSKRPPQSSHPPSLFTGCLSRPLSFQCTADVWLASDDYGILTWDKPCGWVLWWLYPFSKQPNICVLWVPLWASFEWKLKRHHLKAFNSAGPSPRSDKTESNIVKHTDLQTFAVTCFGFYIRFAWMEYAAQDKETLLDFRDSSLARRSARESGNSAI